MKNKIILDESTALDLDDVKNNLTDYAYDISDYKDEYNNKSEVEAEVDTSINNSEADSEKSEDVTEENKNAAIASMLNNAIQSEFQLLDNYNSIVVSILDEKEDEDKIIPILKNIIDDCNIHIGQLQLALSLVNNSAKNIQLGQDNVDIVLDDTKPTQLKAENTDEINNKEDISTEGKENK